MLINVAIACSYCGTPNTLRIEQDSFDLLSSPKTGRALREKPVCQFACKCGSKTELVVSTLRKSKGRSIKVAEDKARAAHDKLVAEAETRNDAIAAKLLAEPGCTCGEFGPHTSVWARRKDGLRDGDVTNGIPGAPRHRYGCPASNGER